MKKRKLLSLSLAVCALSSTATFAQDSTVSHTEAPKADTHHTEAVAETPKEVYVQNGHAIGDLFTNFNFNLDEQVGAFQMHRLHFGYLHNLTEKSFIKFVADAGGTAPGGKALTPWIEFAFLHYDVSEKLELNIGLAPTTTFSHQEGWWGYRYVYKSFMDEWGYNKPAGSDIGVHAKFKAHEKVYFDLSVFNGEGPHFDQDAVGTMLYAADMIIMPSENLLLKAYVDIYPSDDTRANYSSDRSTANVFLGYTEPEKFKIGVEYNMQLNVAHQTDANRSGVSLYSTLVVNEQVEFFGRLDQSANGASVESLEKNPIRTDFLVGVQYKPIDNVNVALNFQNQEWDDSDLNDAPKIFVNVQFKF